MINWKQLTNGDWIGTPVSKEQRDENKPSEDISAQTNHYSDAMMAISLAYMISTIENRRRLERQNEHIHNLAMKENLFVITGQQLGKTSIPIGNYREYWKDPIPALNPHLNPCAEISIPSDVVDAALYALQVDPTYMKEYIYGDWEKESSKPQLLPSFEDENGQTYTQFRIKTENEFIDDFGTDWRAKIDWSIHHDRFLGYILTHPKSKQLAFSGQCHLINCGNRITYKLQHVTNLQLNKLNNGKSISRSVQEDLQRTSGRDRSGISRTTKVVRGKKGKGRIKQSNSGYGRSVARGRKKYSRIYQSDALQSGESHPSRISSGGIIRWIKASTETTNSISRGRGSRPSINRF